MFSPDFYHVYNRGAHKAEIFNDPTDYERFMKLLYIANSTEAIQLSNYKDTEIFSIKQKEFIVQIKSYCLMPNHFHLLIKELIPNGITKFIRKVCTGYANYYNIKYKHSGTIFQGKYKSKPVVDEEYMHTLIDYIHLNPFGIEEPDLIKESKKDYIREAIEYSKNYNFSSFKEYLGEQRKEGLIIDVRHP